MAIHAALPINGSFRSELRFAVAMAKQWTKWYEGRGFKRILFLKSFKLFKFRLYFKRLKGKMFKRRRKMPVFNIINLITQCGCKNCHRFRLQRIQPLSLFISIILYINRLVGKRAANALRL